MAKSWLRMCPSSHPLNRRSWLWLALAALLLRPAGFAESGLAGSIAFVDLDGRPALVDAVSGEAIAFALGALQRAQFPTWSPSGDALAVIVAELGGGRVVHIDAVSGDVTPVYQPRDRAPIYLGFSPDGATLAVLATRFSGPGLALDLLDVPRARAGEPHAAPPIAFAAPFYWDWIPGQGDGPTRLLVHQNVLSPQRRAGITGLEAFDLQVQLPNPGAFQSPSVAPDGRHLAYAAAVGDARSVAVLRYDPLLNEAEIVERWWHTGVAAFAWRPDSSALVLQSPPVASPHSFGSLELLEVASGNRRLLSDDVVIAFWWSPDGRYLAALSLVGGGAPGGAIGEGDSDLRTVRVTAPAQPVQQGRPPLLALKLIEVDSGVVTPWAVVSVSPLFYGQYLPFFDQYARSHSLWSPASDAIVLPVLDEAGVSTITVFGVDGSARELVPGDMPAWGPR
jgi:TolB protein